MPRPYKALQKQGYKHYFTALTGRENVGFCTPRRCLGLNFVAPSGRKECMSASLKLERLLLPTSYFLLAPLGALR